MIFPKFNFKWRKVQSYELGMAHLYVSANSLDKLVKNIESDVKLSKLLTNVKKNGYSMTTNNEYNQFVNG